MTRTVEFLERRDLLSVAPGHQTPEIQPTVELFHAPGNPSPAWTASYQSGLTPAQMRHAYGIDQVSFGGITGDGAGQTIAIVDLGDYPNIASDVDAFDQQFSIDGGSEKLYGQYGPSSSFLTKYEPQGVPSPASGLWGQEIALDVNGTAVWQP